MENQPRVLFLLYTTDERGWVAVVLLPRSRCWVWIMHLYWLVLTWQSHVSPSVECTKLIQHFSSHFGHSDWFTLQLGVKKLQLNLYPSNYKSTILPTLPQYPDTPKDCQREAPPVPISVPITQSCKCAQVKHWFPTLVLRLYCPECFTCAFVPAHLIHFS